MVSRRAASPRNQQSNPTRFIVMTTHQAESKYPSRLSFVLKLRGDAAPHALAGRLENLVTGQRFEFASAREMVDAIAHELDTSASEPPAE
jgi:hypothetical protein